VEIGSDETGSFSGSSPFKNATSVFLGIRTLRPSRVSEALQQLGNIYAAPSIGQTIAGAVGQQIGNTSIQLTQRELQVPPTLEVPPGYLFDVLVDRDIVLTAPYGAFGAP
jgi:type IV secretory pathway VirB10-like protein